jgi:hypothetical protein
MGMCMHNPDAHLEVLAVLGVYVHTVMVCMNTLYNQNYGTTSSTVLQYYSTLVPVLSISM